MRDYKHRVIDRRRVREVPPWFWLVAISSGAALIFLIIYLATLPGDGAVPGGVENITEIPAPANIGVPAADNKPTSNNSNASSKKLTATPAPPSTQARFEFFDALPKMKINTPPEPPPVAPARTVPPRAITAPKETQKSPPELAPRPTSTPVEPTRLPPAGDRYMLLAGYFRNAREAEQLQARIGALGFSSGVQTVKSGSKEPRYRVRLGPFGQKQADEVRNKLRTSGITAVPLKSRD